MERLCKLEKGKISGRLATIRKRHLASTKLPLHLVKWKRDEEWSVQSADQKQEYTVLQENETCPTNCQLLCKECAVCIHMYSCTCMDFVINHTICKHIHLAATSKVEKNLLTDTAVKISSKPLFDHNIILQEDNVLHKIKDRMHQLLSRIHILTGKCISVHEMKMAEQHLKNAENILQIAKQETSLATQSLCPDNTCIQKQRFHSTRKRRKLATTRLTKPTIQEKLNVIECLEENKPLYKKTLSKDSTISEGEGYIICMKFYSYIVCPKCRCAEALLRW